MKLYIDCDPGIDDAFALIYLLTRQNLDIVGIGCVVGNVNVKKAKRNLKLLVSNLKPDIKIFEGSQNYIIENQCKSDKSYYGNDGIAEFFQSKYYLENKEEIENRMEMCNITDKSAVLELIELSKTYKGQLVILALGPLTNIALASLLDPTFQSNVQKIMIMGSCYKGVGNSTIYVGAEYNFSMDPESVEIVISRMQCPKYLYPMDVTGNPLSEREFFKKWNLNECIQNFVETCFDFFKAKERECLLYDLNATIAFLHPETVTKIVTRNVAVDLMSDHNRGGLVVDMYDVHLETNKFHQIFLIEEVDGNKILELIKKF